MPDSEGDRRGSAMFPSTAAASVLPAAGAEGEEGAEEGSLGDPGRGAGKRSGSVVDFETFCEVAGDAPVEQGESDGEFRFLFDGSSGGRPIEDGRGWKPDRRLAG